MLALMPLMCAKAQAPQPAVTLRVNTQLVEISAIVKDSHGNPVADLKAGDFELYDNGKKQEIRVFNLEDHRQAAGQPPAAPTAPAVSVLEAGMFTNRTQPEPGAPNAPTIVVIDAGNTWDIARMTWADLVYARDQLVQFLRQVHPEDRLGIYLMGDKRFWILHEYNQTCADLVERLASWKGTAAPGSPSAKFPDVWTEFAVHFARVDEETATAIHRAQFWSQGAMGSSALPEEATSLPNKHQNIASNDSLGQQAPTPAVGEVHTSPAPSDQGTYVSPEQSGPLAVLEAVANHLASVPGRKNVVLISGKMFLPEEFKDQVRVLRPIVQSGVAVYAIDPSGLAPYDLDASYELSGMAKLVTLANPGAGLADLNRAYDWRRRVILMLQSSLTGLAEATGGRVFVNTNDVLGAIHSSFEDSRVTYTLGFYPKTSSNDGSFHPIKVKLPAREHLSIHYRSGYFEPEPPSRDPHRREVELRQAVWSPVDATAIELNGSILPVAAPDDCALKLNVGLAAVSLLPDNGRWNGQIEVSLFQRDNSGNAYEPLTQTLGLKLQQSSYDNALKTGLPYRRSFKLDPKASSLRVVVRDLGSGNVGTLTIPVPGVPK